MLPKASAEAEELAAKKQELDVFRQAVLNAKEPCLKKVLEASVKKMEEELAQLPQSKGAKNQTA